MTTAQMQALAQKERREGARWPSGSLKRAPLRTGTPKGTAPKTRRSLCRGPVVKIIGTGKRPTDTPEMDRLTAESAAARKRRRVGDYYAPKERQAPRSRA